MSDSDTDTPYSTSDLHNPLSKIDGMESVDIACGVGDNHRNNEVCTGWNKTVELDEPAEYVPSTDSIKLPGFNWECPECQQTAEFIIEGIWVSKYA